MKNYTIEYQLGEHTKHLSVEADNPGHAFQKARKKLGKLAALLRCSIQRNLFGQQLWEDYEAPKIISEAPVLPATKSEQTEMPFLK